MKDPLAGKRRGIINRETKVLIWPAVNNEGVTVPCPVEKGDRFNVSGVPVIEIEKVARKLPAGRRAEWHATYIRHEVDRPQLLRRVPSGLPSKASEHVGLTEQEKARRESAYTSSLALSLGREEPESVGPDWDDPGVAEREDRRKAAQRERQHEREVQATKSRLNRLIRNAKTPQEAEWLLGQIISLCEAAEKGDMDRAA